MTPIVDTHVHYWEPESPERPYDPHGMRLGDPVSVEDLLATVGAAGVDKILQVTPSIMGWDNREVPVPGGPAVPPPGVRTLWA